VRVRDGGDWHELGSPGAARRLAGVLKQRHCEGPCAFGLVSPSVKRVAGRAVVALPLDGRPMGTLAFDVGEHDGHTFVENVRFDARPDRP
jgi:hypothetical protein